MNNIVRKREEGEPTMLKNGEPKIVFEARIGAVINFPVLEDAGEGYVQKMYEKYVRSPGTRIIALRDDKIYLQKEDRVESEKKWDWRLPGGKVVDSFVAYKEYLNKPLPEEIVFEAARKELQEEAHLDSENMMIFDKKICGTLVEWDLYYVIAKDVVGFDFEGTHAEGEEIGESGWFEFSKVLEMCQTGEISEGRTVSALLQFIHKQK